MAARLDRVDLFRRANHVHMVKNKEKLMTNKNQKEPPSYAPSDDPCMNIPINIQLWDGSVITCTGNEFREAMDNAVLKCLLGESE